VSIIGPARTLRDLQESAREVREGTKAEGLPPVLSDALQMKKETAYQDNRKLAAMISAAMRLIKPSDEHGPLFVLGWRMYPNADHPHWKEQEGSHICGCSCGGAAPGPDC
jgi:hypothetical protein